MKKGFSLFLAYCLFFPNLSSVAVSDDSPPVGTVPSPSQVSVGLPPGEGCAYAFAGSTTNCDTEFSIRTGIFPLAHSLCSGQMPGNQQHLNGQHCGSFFQLRSSRSWDAIVYSHSGYRASTCDFVLCQSWGECAVQWDPQIGWGCYSDNATRVDHYEWVCTLNINDPVTCNVENETP